MTPETSPTAVEVKVGSEVKTDARPLTAFLVNPHKVLGIDTTASTEHIQAAYTILLRNNRPDAAMPEEQWQKCMERITAIEAAYHKLVPWAGMACWHGARNVACGALGCTGCNRWLGECGRIVVVYKDKDTGEVYASCAMHDRTDLWEVDETLWRREVDSEELYIF